MKLFNLIWVLALAVAGLACDNWTDQAVVNGCRPGEFVNTDGRCEAEGTGGTGGSAGTGGTGVGACTDAEDQAIYAELEYTDGGSNPPVVITGSAAASGIASDCVFGSPKSIPPLEGCGALASEIIQCAIPGTCTDEQVQALSDCVENCMQDAIMEVTGSMLSAECGACYSESVSCSAEKCATSGCSNPTSTSCITCRCENDCTPGFDRCSGLPPSGDCD